MNDLRKATITTLEVAEMMDVEHAKLIRKLEGDKSRKGYINTLHNRSSWQEGGGKNDRTVV